MHIIPPCGRKGLICPTRLACSLSSFLANLLKSPFNSYLSLKIYVWIQTYRVSHFLYGNAYLYPPTTTFTLFVHITIKLHLFYSANHSAFIYHGKRRFLYFHEDNEEMSLSCKPKVVPGETGEE